MPGYPAEDLYLKRHFIEANRRAVEELARGVGGIDRPGRLRRAGRRRRRLAATPTTRSPCSPTAPCAAVYRKNRLPNYAVFDEQRYFVPGDEPLTVEVAGAAGRADDLRGLSGSPGPPAATEAEQGATLIANPSGSPYHRGKGREREEMFAERSRAYGTHFAFCNLVGGQDELVFDGQSLVTDPERRADRPRRPVRGGAAGLRDPGRPRPAPIAEPLSDLDEVYAALVLGLRDYVAKNGFRHVGVALSGGIDSALVALLAADAVGPERLSCVVMPSPHSSSETQGDARTIAANLGCELIEIPIEPMMDGYERALPAAARTPDLAAENIQARIRGNLMMALSNRHGWLVLTTGNKSEMSVGYATLYGDMAGGFAAIKDVPKTLVYELVAPPQRAGRAASSSRPRCSSGRPRPSCAPTSSTATPCPPTTCSTASSRPTSSATRAARR